MKSVLSIVRKEMRSYFNSPIAYIVIVFFLVFTAVWLFYVAQFVLQDVRKEILAPVDPLAIHA